MNKMFKMKVGGLMAVGLALSFMAAACGNGGKAQADGIQGADNDTAGTSVVSDAGELKGGEADEDPAGGATGGNADGTTGGATEGNADGTTGGAAGGNADGTTGEAAGGNADGTAGGAAGGNAGGTASGWQAAYAGYISGLAAEGDGGAAPSVVQFAFVDEDDIPEMAVYLTEGGTSYNFCTYNDGQLKVLGEDVPYFITLNILPKENRFVYTFSKGRNREDALGHISSGEMKIEPYGTMDRKDDTPVCTWQDAEVSEEEYLNNISGLLDGRDAGVVVGMVRDGEAVDNEQFFTVDGALAYLNGDGQTAG
jgi:hypothetical protein